MISIRDTIQIQAYLFFEPTKYWKVNHLVHEVIWWAKRVLGRYKREYFFSTADRVQMLVSRHRGTLLLFSLHKGGAWSTGHTEGVTHVPWLVVRWAEIPSPVWPYGPHDGDDRVRPAFQSQQGCFLDSNWASYVTNPGLGSLACKLMILTALSPLVAFSKK